MGAEEKQKFRSPHRSWLGCTDRAPKDSEESQVTGENNCSWTSYVQGLEKGMATHSILARRNPMDSGAWRTTVHRSRKRVGYNWACALRHIQIAQEAAGEDATTGRHIAWSWEVWVDDTYMQASTEIWLMCNTLMSCAHSNHPENRVRLSASGSPE